MKIAKIIPLFKSGTRQQINNYRSISLLPSFSKLLEKLIHKLLYSFLQMHDILYKQKYGFRRRHYGITGVALNWFE